MEKSKVLEKLDSLFKEELWGRLEPKDVGISKFKILDDFFNTVETENMVQDTLDICKKHIMEHPSSVTALYLTGLIGYHAENIEDLKYLRKLIDIFTENHKWAVVKTLAEKMLEYGETSLALRALATSLERLGRHREAIPVWDNLLKKDRFDADVSKKLAFAIIDDDPEKSAYYMKLSIEGYIKNGKFDEISLLWNKLSSVSTDDVHFFDRIERFLIESKQDELAASMIKIMLNKYRDEANPDQSIEFLKKILKYRSEDIGARKDLLKFLEIKYNEHSQFTQFMTLSGLNNFKVPVKTALQEFEKNIVFDKGNSVFHKSWGLGKISAIDSENITIDFSDKTDHRMSIKMALQSLLPLHKDHFYVLEHTESEYIKALFTENFMDFFSLLVKSFGGKMTADEIKSELSPKYVDPKNWSKWWNKTRAAIRKDPHFGVSDKKKDLFFIREKPVTFADELLEEFTKSTSFSKKLDFAMEFINNVDKEEGGPVSVYFTDYFSHEAKGNSATRQILSFFILKDFARLYGSETIKLDDVRSKIVAFIRDSSELPMISMKISSYDYKKEFVNLIEEAREDWPVVLTEMLFDTPIRIHRYVIGSLVKVHAYSLINSFIDRVIGGARQYPEIFLWVSKNIFSKTWEYDWLDYSREGLAISYFRLMNELKKIEIDGNRLKNMSIDVLFDGEPSVLKEMVEGYDLQLLAKMYDIFTNLPYVEDSDKTRFYEMIKQKHGDFQKAVSQTSEEWSAVEKIIVSRDGYEKKKQELDRLANVELISITKELSAVSEASSDMRENVEYNSLLERQSVLKASILKLEGEMKKAEVIDLSSVSTETVGIGTKVIFTDNETGEKLDYAILGPWDADFENRILSYRSPIAKALIGRSVGGSVRMKLGDEERNFTVTSIEKLTF